MKQQVFVIHGGEAFDTYEEYLDLLQAWRVSLEDFTKVGWKTSLGKELGENFEVFKPAMPNAMNAKYLEWRIYFEKYLQLLDDGVIFIGHSLGAIFLVKYFSENITSKKIKATFLVAAPFNTKSTHPLADFLLEEDLSLFKAQCGKIFFYHSKDDKVVPFSNLLDYQELFPEATYRIFDDRGHFNQEHFPEIVEDIREGQEG